MRSLSVLPAMNMNYSPRRFLLSPPPRNPNPSAAMTTTRPVHPSNGQSMRRYSMLQSTISTPYLPTAAVTSLSSLAASAATTKTFSSPTNSTSFATIMQNRSLSSNPPPDSGGGGMNLGNIFNNQGGANYRKKGETLEQYGVDLTKLAKENKLDPVIGRHEEIRRTLQILGKIIFFSLFTYHNNILGGNSILSHNLFPIVSCSSADEE